MCVPPHAGIGDAGVGEPTLTLIDCGGSSAADQQGADPGAADPGGADPGLEEEQGSLSVEEGVAATFVASRCQSTTRALRGSLCVAERGSGGAPRAQLRASGWV